MMSLFSYTLFFPSKLKLLLLHDWLMSTLELRLESNEIVGCVENFV